MGVLLLLLIVALPLGWRLWDTCWNFLRNYRGHLSLLDLYLLFVLGIYFIFCVRIFIVRYIFTAGEEIV